MENRLAHCHLSEVNITNSRDINEVIRPTPLKALRGGCVAHAQHLVIKIIKKFCLISIQSTKKPQKCTLQKVIKKSPKILSQ